ncbi:MAG: cation diffusion facilitator family transporter [Candidatus Curtissbacteria bacterium]|nr:cation diffusion facilitator family transporter [bacterium]MDZ4209908.1 cation diffusion facilitator family transporter [Candidatus Curtissbacteria bacterium]
MSRKSNPSLTPFLWLSVGASLATIALKFAAYFITGSVGLFSDALESIVNLAAATMALALLKIAEKPADEDHMYGHTKAEYFSSVTEGVLIIFAALSIGSAAWARLTHPQPLEDLSLGLPISILASTINFAVGFLLLKTGKKHHSITLEADAHHLLTDVWTSLGVIAGLVMVAFTGLTVLDPIIALIVALNIVWTGVDLLKKSAAGFMDSSIPQDEKNKILKILEKYQKNNPIKCHEVRTRQSGAQRFISLHVLTPNKWSVERGHNLLENIEKEIKAAVPNSIIFGHLEPVGDPRSFED